MSRVAGRGRLRAVARAITRGLIVAALGTVAAACSPAPSASPGPIATASIAAPASGTPTAPESPVEGVLVDIDSAGLADVDGFALRLGDGRTLVFRVGSLDNGDEFPVGHLAEHLATSAPIRVFFQATGPDLVVHRIEDAG